MLVTLVRSRVCFWYDRNKGCALMYWRQAACAAAGSAAASAWLQEASMPLVLPLSQGGTSSQPTYRLLGHCGIHVVSGIPHLAGCVAW